MKRIALYIFYDKEGYVAEYVKYYIKALTETADRVVFIVNGNVQPDGRKEIENLGAEIFLRENSGLDFGAWKDVILKIGFQTISTYDELILCNCSCFGPVYPLAEVFGEMESRRCDFWGITKHPANGVLLIKEDKSTAIVEHVQSYFVVFTKRVLESSCFQKWWTDLIPTSTFANEVAYHENKFTQYLSSGGFSYDTYVDCDRYFKLNSSCNLTFAFADEILKVDRDPFVKRKLFFSKDNRFIKRGEGFATAGTIDSLKETEYPVKYIYADLLRNHKLSDLDDGLPLTWIHRKSGKYLKRKLALVCRVSHSESAEYMAGYLSNMPDGSDLFVISPEQGVLDAYRNDLTDQSVFNEAHYLLKPDSGSDSSSLLLTFAPYFKKYDAFCFVNDSALLHVQYSSARDILKRGLECCLNTKSYVKDLVEALFDDSSCCGVMLPPFPFASEYDQVCQEKFADKKDLFISLFKRLGLHVPFDDKFLVPSGTMFWVRSAALKDLFDYKWSCEDFHDDSVSQGLPPGHLLNTLASYCAQNRGFFTMRAMPESFAELYLNSLTYMLRDYNIELERMFGRGSWADQLNNLKSSTAVDYENLK